MDTEKNKNTTTVVIDMPGQLYESFMQFAFTASELWNVGTCILLGARKSSEEDLEKFRSLAGKWIACFPDKMRDEFIQYAEDNMGFSIRSYQKRHVNDADAGDITH